MNGWMAATLDCIQHGYRTWHFSRVSVSLATGGLSGRNTSCQAERLIKAATARRDNITIELGSGTVVFAAVRPVVP
jgi:hypothetical protein